MTAVAEVVATILKCTVVLSIPCLALLVRRGLSADAKHFLALAGLVGAVTVLVAAPLLPDLPVAILPASSAPASPASAPPGASFAGLLLGVWLAGLALLTWRQARAVGGARRIAAHARPACSDALRAAFYAAKRELGIRRPVRLLTAQEVAVPVAGGWLRPWVVLPRASAAWPRGRRRAVLLHELAHADRWDCLTQGLADLAAAVLWFHPLAGLLARRMRVLRERACDDRVLARGARPSGYAGLLLRVLDPRRRARPPVAATAGLARRSEVSDRVRTVLAPGRARAALGGRARFAIATVLLASALLTAALTPVRAAARADLGADSIPAVAAAPPAPPILPQPGRPVEVSEAGPAEALSGPPIRPAPRPSAPEAPAERLRELLGHVEGALRTELAAAGVGDHPLPALLAIIKEGEWREAPDGGVELVMMQGNGGATRGRLLVSAYVLARRR